MNRTVLTLLAATILLPSQALAWRHLGTDSAELSGAWLPEDMPVKYWVADDEIADDTPWQLDQNPDADCEETVPSGYCKESALWAINQWSSVPCTDLTMSYEGNIENSGFTGGNQRNYITFNDPNDDITEPGVLAVTLPLRLGTAFLLNGETYLHLYDADLLFNEDVDFTTTEAIESGNCSGQINFKAVVTHEMGHSLGMGHACEDGEACTDPLLKSATMEWSEGACELGSETINEDDMEGITALYGPYATFECSHQRPDGSVFATVPFDMKCVVVSDSLENITDVSWRFGDGGTADTVNVSHTYEAAGNYTVNLEVNGSRDDCGDEGWGYSFRRVGLVTACDVPEAAFTIEHVDGLEYSFLNESDVSVYGCISDIQWEVYAGEGVGGKMIGDSINAWEPNFTFPETGTYTVVLNLGGAAGTGAAKITLDVTDYRGEGRGCDTVGLGGLGGVLTLSLGLLAIRRRR